MPWIDRLEMRQAIDGADVKTVEIGTGSMVSAEHLETMICRGFFGGVRRISPTTYVLFRRQRPSLPTDSSLSL